MAVAIISVVSVLYINHNDYYDDDIIKTSIKKCNHNNI